MESGGDPSSTPPAFLVVNADGRIVYHTDAAAIRLGYGADALAAFDGLRFLHYEDRGLLRTALRESDKLSTRLRFLRGDGLTESIPITVASLGEGQFVLAIAGEEAPLPSTQRKIDPVRAAMTELQTAYATGVSAHELRQRALKCVLEAAGAELALAIRPLPAMELATHGEVLLVRAGVETPVLAERAELGSVLAEAVRGRGPVSVNDVPEALSLAIVDARLALRNVYAVPSEGPSGDVDLVVVVGNRPAPFDAETCEALEPLLVLAATLIRASHDRYQTETSADQLFIQEIDRTVGATSDLTEALEVVLRTVGSHVGWVMGQAWVQRIEREELHYSPAFFGPSLGALRLRKLVSRNKYAFGAGIPGKVWNHRTSMVVETLSEDVEFEGAASYVAHGFTAAYWVPIVAGCGVVAVLEFFAKEHRPEHAKALGFVQEVARQVAPNLACKLGDHYRHLFRSVMRTVRDGVVITSIGGAGGPRVELANQAFENITRLGSHEIESFEPQSLLPDCDECPVGCRGGPSDGCGVPLQRTLRTRDGELVDAQVSNAPVTDRLGWPTHIVSAIRCVPPLARSEVDRLRLAIAEANSSWRETVDAIDLSLLMVDADCRIVRVNRAARDLFTKGRDLLVGQRLEELADAAPLKQALPLLSTALRERVRAESQTCDDPLGRVWDVAAIPTDAAGARAVLVVRDVTVTAKLQDSLRRSETMAALGSLVSGVAHEVRNPLFGISATLDAFESQLGSSDEFVRFLEVLRAEVNRLAKLMGTLLEYGRPPELARAWCKLSDVVESAIESSALEAARRRVNVRQVRTNTEIRAYIDGTRIVQVLVNLLDNAIHHSPEAGTISVEYSSHVGSTGQEVRIEVSDEGPGIAPEDLPRLFEPFFTKRRGGTGLGLSIVQQIVDQHGGRVEAGRRQPHGAKLTVYLPSGEQEDGAKHGG